MKIDERNKKYYTEEGLAGLNERSKSFIRLFNENKFPRQSIVLGFGSFHIKDKEECKSRIKELLEIIGGKIKIETEKIKNGEGFIIKEKIWQ